MLHKSHALRQFQILGNYIYIYICFLFGIELGLFFASKCHSAISLGMHYCNHHNTIEHQINPINDISVKQSNNRFKKNTLAHHQGSSFQKHGRPSNICNRPGIISCFTMVSWFIEHTTSKHPISRQTPRRVLFQLQKPVNDWRTKSCS